MLLAHFLLGARSRRSRSTLPLFCTHGIFDRPNTVEQPKNLEPTTMKRLSALLPFVALASLSVNAQYCSPVFSNGCFNWRVISVTIGSSIDWTSSDCSVSDQTATVAEVSTADSIPLTVTTGTWAGCSVWVDWDQSSSFETTENLYHMYVGGDPSYTYAFNIGVPPGTVLGQYRMRILGAWGSDGYTDGDNGSGPCGSFQYGSFDDFTLDVTTTTSISDRSADRAAISASPNPTTGLVTLSLNNAGSAHADILMESMDGRIVGKWQHTGPFLMKIDISNLPAGMYLLRDNADTNARPIRIVKQ